MTKIEQNIEMMQMISKAKAQIEHKIRTAYNAGYKDGLKDGAADLINRLADATEEKK